MIYNGRGGYAPVGSTSTPNAAEGGLKNTLIPKNSPPRQYPFRSNKNILNKIIIFYRTNSEEQQQQLLMELELIQRSVENTNCPGPSLKLDSISLEFSNCPGPSLKLDSISLVFF